MENLRKYGHVQQACTSINITFQAMYKRRKTDEELARDWEEAIDEYDAFRLRQMEEEADRRAITGTVRPVFYKGKAAGAVREYSDTLLIFRMKALAPEKYRDNASLRIDGKLQHEHGPPAARMSPEDAATLEAASPEMRRQMLQVIKGSK